MIRFALINSVVAIVAIALAGSLSKTTAQTAPNAAQAAQNAADAKLLPDGPGKAVVVKACLSCHSTKPIIAKPGRSEDDWVDVISKMVGRGAILSDDDADLVIQYLSTNFGPDTKNAPSASADKPVQAGAGTTANSSESPSSSSPVRVNKANAGELESALGLSKAEAESIVHYREQHGNFKTWEDVSSIPGIPTEKIKANQSRLVFDSE